MKIKYSSCLIFTTLYAFPGDVYHLSFDDLQPTDCYSTESVINDFHANYGLGFWDGVEPSTNRAAIDSSQSVTGSGNSMRITFPANKLKTAESGVDTRIPLAGTASANTFAADELYLSYWIKFSDNFDFSACGGKLPSLGGADFAARTNQWKGRIMWRNGGGIQFYMELPHADDGIDADSLRFWGEKEVNGGNICANQFTSYLKTPGWHNIELHYKLNTPGQDDGLFEGWVDGNVGHKIVNASVFGNYRPESGEQNKLTINAILLSAFLGGSDSLYHMSEDTYIWVDEFRVSRERIDEFSKYSTKSPSPLQSKPIQNPRKFIFDKPSRYRLNGQHVLSSSHFQ